MKKFLVLIFISSLMFVAGCETFSGLGRDVQNAGDWIEEKASK